MTISATTQGIKPGVCTSTNRPVNPFDGQVIYMTDVDQTAVWDGSQWTVLAPIAGNRNGVINGNMNVWQRGTSVANGGGKSYSPDRWWCSRGGAVGGMTVSRQTSTQTGFSYSARVQRDSGNTSTQGIYFYQDFETINSIRFSGGNVSLSFYAKLGANYSSASSILNYTITYGTGTDQSFYSGMTGQANAAGSTVTLTSTFQRFTVTAAIPSSATQISIGFFYTPVGTASTNDWFEITGIQLEAGAVATPFEFEDYGTTLLKCKRYYWRNAIYAGGGVGGGGTIPIVSIQFPVTMRTTPTFGYISNGPTMNGLADETINGFYSGLPSRDTSTDGTELLFTKTGAAWTSGQGITVKNVVIEARAEL
jgi:hypothetical protein